MQKHKNVFNIFQNNTNKCTMEIYFKDLKLTVGTSNVLNGISGRIRNSAVTAVMV
jgi:ABC-type phosphate transport system ATPase subunit